MPNHKHLFSIDDNLIDAASVDDIAATRNGLLEAGLFEMPFNRDVYIDTGAIVWTARALDGERLIVGPFGDGQVPQCRLHDQRGRKEDDIYRGNGLDLLVEGLRTFLIVLLATRNAVKRTTENKLAKLGIGKSSRNRFAYVTTISLPSEMDFDPDNPPKKGHNAPHLRRGHIRRQHYGKENKLEKVIWIASVFVNADPDFVESRGRYRIRA